MSEDIKRQVPIIVSLLTYFVMLFGAMTMLVTPKVLINSESLGMCLQLALFFPTGVGFLFNTPDARVVALTFVVISYISFMIFLVAFIRARIWTTYGMLCFGFAILLLLNITGCREAHKGLANITMMRHYPGLESVDSLTRLGLPQVNVSAHYGKIYGGFMQSTYYLNPTPNSRNIEFDPKQNLIHGLDPLEQVTVP